jgi:transcription initiation factor TFIIIB Brf1 subunit/transcription initiation factor TFIIB
MSSTSEDSVKSRLVEVSDQLQIPSDTLQITLVRLDQLRNEPDVTEDNLDDTAAAALALSCREDGLPVSEGDIADAWTATLSSDHDINISHQQLEAVSSYIDMDEVPAHPMAMVRSFGEAVEMSEALIDVARQMLQDSFEADPTVVAGGPTPAATAGAVLELAALVNGESDTYDASTLGRASGAGEVTVQNRSRDLRELLGEERLQDDRYQATTTSGGSSSQSAAQSTSADSGSSQSTSDSSSDPSSADSSSSQSTAADGAGASTGQTASESSLSAESVEEEIDDLVDDLDIGPSTRLLARGMVSDAVKAIDSGAADELAATMVVAASRMEEGDIDAVEAADARSFQPRAISQLLDTLDDVVDVDIPRRDPADIVEDLVAELGLSESVHEESLTSLERYDAAENDADYTTAELGSGAVLFAATVGRSQVDATDLSAISGADPEFITDAMNSIVVSLCLGLVRGDIAYEDCAWTTDLLESELSPNIGDAYTGRVIAVAQTYTAGREGRHIDDSTLDVVFADD